MNDLWRTINDPVHSYMSQLNDILFEPSPPVQYATEYEPEKVSLSIIFGDTKYSNEMNNKNLDL